MISLNVSSNVVYELLNYVRCQWRPTLSVAEASEMTTLGVGRTGSAFRLKGDLEDAWERAEPAFVSAFFVLDAAFEKPFPTLWTRWRLPCSLLFEDCFADLSKS